MSSVSAEGKQSSAELESAKRVRNKISIAHDSSLSKVLSLLLPRLLRKLDTNFEEILTAHISTIGHISEADISSTQIEHDEIVSIRNHIHNEYRCIIDHAIDRISDGEFDVIPIIETISEYILGLYQQSCAATIRSSRRSPGETYALRLQRECMIKLATRRQEYTNDNDTEMKRRANALYSILKSGTIAVEDMHKNDNNVQNVQQQNYRGIANAQDTTWKHKHIVAGWLVIDSIALLLDIRAISVDQQLSGEVATKKKKDTNQDNNFLHHPHYQAIINLVSSLASSGVYNLFLDLIISQHYSSGMSTQGLARLRASAVSDMTHPPSTSDWNILRLAVLQIAVGNGKGEGIFGDNGHRKEGSEGLARAVTLLVLTTSGRGLSRELNSISLTRFAGSLLDTYLDKGDRNQLPSMMLQSKKKKSRKDVSPSVVEDGRNALIVQASSLLLCLALGGKEAQVVLQKHEEDWMSDSSSQLMVDNVASDRSPLSSRMISAVLHFVTEQLQKNMKVSSQLNKDIILLFNLSFHSAQSALKVTNSNDDLIMTHRLQVGWGDRIEGAAARGAALMESLSTYLCQGSSKVEELDTLLGQMLNVSIDFLRTEVLNNIGVDTNTQLDPEEDLGMGEEVEDERIRAIRQRRIEQARDFQARLLRERREKLVPPIEIRISIVKIIQTVMSVFSIPTTNDDTLFDIPILLFNCLAVDQELSAHIAIALEKMVIIYGNSIKKDKVSEDVGEFAAAPLLPPLLSASTSDSSASKRLAISWATQVIGYLDQDAAFAICSFLLNDPNDAVTDKAAKEYISSVKPVVSANNEQKNEHGCSSAVMFFDSSNDLDMQIMSAKLIGQGTSVLPDNGCSNDMDVDNVSKGLCEICFDDGLVDDQMYSLLTCRQHKVSRT